MGPKQQRDGGERRRNHGVVAITVAASGRGCRPSGLPFASSLSKNIYEPGCIYFAIGAVFGIFVGILLGHTRRLDARLREADARLIALGAGRALARVAPRERQVLDSICAGATNAEIATTLKTTERTVKSQVSSILQKLGARDRATAIIPASEAGWRRR